MALLAVPYQPFRGDPRRNTAILDHLVAHPQWVTSPVTPEEARVVAAAYLTAPDHLIWEVWNDGTLVGILLLTNLTQSLDALFHFVFFDHNLIGKRRFLRRFLTYCFSDRHFRRLTMHIPEHISTLIHFARVSLGFRFEGEGRGHKLLESLKIEHPAVWVAKQGSRREQGHYHDGAWRDVMVLRLLAEEHQKV